MSRYSTGAQGEAQPGSRGRVLRNLASITSVRELERVESEVLLSATERAMLETQSDHRFTAHDIRQLHRIWLGEIYPWAGEYRDVNISKDGFMFAAARHVPRLMEEFEAGPLRIYTPCSFQERADQEEALAVTHAELILIHPFREGNGRCARLLAILMGLQAGLPSLNFAEISSKEEQNRYIAAIHAAVGHDYQPMREVFRKVIEGTLDAEGAW